MLKKQKPGELGPSVRRIHRHLAGHKGKRAVRVCRSTVHNLMRETHTPFKKVKGQRMTAVHMAKRKSFCEKMLRLLKARRVKLERLVFSDEKLFRAFAPHDASAD